MSQQYYHHMPEPIHYPPPPTQPNSIYPYTHTGSGKTSTYYDDSERPPYEPQNTSYMPPQVSYPPPPSFEQAVNSGSDDAHIKFNPKPKYQDLFWYPTACKQTHRTPSSNPNCQNGQFIAIVVFLLFTYYWVSQVIQTFIHVTTSGVFASYYFLEGTPQGVPSSPTLKSAKRAATTSFGSICFGSLLVAILQVIRELLRSLAQDTDNPLGAFCVACAAVLVGCVDALLEFFNFYAYTQVAIYGKSFCDSAKDTWTMIQDRGVEAIINDNLIGTVIIMGSFLVGMVAALFGYLYTIIFHPNFNVGGGFTPLIVFLSFIIGFQMLSIIGSVIFSGSATTFVCLAENPDALARIKPDLYNAIIRTYPAFAQGIRFFSGLRDCLKR
ncbi:16629_t:CDS:10 [Racocetra persica]|uniref:16629_t:CDS:1 n=1 Tax=Racocetra persica TaxID=160502 RepID=A0ACA9M500_9GLOM|nr:16629_t:CDS:10 [Racocetra persica]